MHSLFDLTECSCSISITSWNAHVTSNHIISPHSDAKGFKPEWHGSDYLISNCFHSRRLKYCKTVQTVDKLVEIFVEKSAQTHNDNSANDEGSSHNIVLNEKKLKEKLSFLRYTYVLWLKCFHEFKRILQYIQATSIIRRMFRYILMSIAQDERRTKLLILSLRTAANRPGRIGATL